MATFLPTLVQNNNQDARPDTPRPAHSMKMALAVIPQTGSGASTPPGELGAKSRKYLLTANDDEIRAILQARLDREATLQKEGSLSRPVRLRDLVFTKRFTTFDRQNPLSAESVFHGFFTLFWLSLGILLVKLAAQNWKDYGSVVGNAEILHIMFDRDIVVLGLTDGVMVGSTIFGFGLQKLVQYDFITWKRTGYVIQHLWQTFFLWAVLGWIWYRAWPWTHTIFMVLHTLTFVMKQHGYAFYNGYLSQLFRRKQLLQKKVKELQNMQSDKEDRDYTVIKSSTLDHPEILHSSHRPILGSRIETDPKSEPSHIGSIVAAIDRGEEITEHDIEIFLDTIRSEIHSINRELNKNVTDPTKQYPNNLTVANWFDYTCIPTLVYELEYPRQQHINWWYVAEKTSATLGIIWVMIVVSQSYIYPRVAATMAMKEAGMSLAERWVEFPWVVSDLLFPMLLEQLLTWYVIWECTLNVLAELTGFSDRNFYGPWWNSVSFEEYARDWNKPVHDFLLRHVYNSSISTFHLSKSIATLVTFLLSAMVHELLMFVLFKKVRGYLFAMQLMQVPLASLSKTSVMKGRPILGNLFFWFGLFVGPAIITSLYLIV